MHQDPPGISVTGGPVPRRVDGAVDLLVTQPEQDEPSAMAMVAADEQGCTAWS